MRIPMFAKKTAQQPGATRAQQALSAIETALSMQRIQVDAIVQTEDPADRRAGARALQLTLQQLGRQADALRQNPEDAESLVRSNIFAKTCDRLLQQLRSIEPDAADRPAWHYVHSTSAQLAPLLQTSVSFGALPPLATATLLGKQRDATSGRTNKKTIATSLQTAYMLGANQSELAGGHGKLHVARKVGDGQQKWVVKVQRSHRKMLQGRSTEARPLAELLQRAARSADAAGRIESGLTRKQKLFAADTGAWRLLVTPNASAAVAAHFVDEFGKYHQVMVAMDGDLTSLSQAAQASVLSASLPQATVQHARLSLASQTFEQLALLHKKRSITDFGLAHRDLKLANILFNEGGAARIIDFDEALPLRFFGSGAESAYRQTGTISSPEMHIVALNAKRRPLGRANDVWALSISMLDFGFTSPVSHLFSAAPPSSGKGEAAKAAQTALLAAQQALHSAAEADKPAHARRVARLADFAAAANKEAAAEDGQRLHNMEMAFAGYTVWHEAFIAKQATLSYPLPAPTPQQKQMLFDKSQLLLQHTKFLDADIKQRKWNHDFDVLLNYFNDRGVQDAQLTTLLLQKGLAPNPAQRASASSIAAALLQPMQLLADDQRQNVLNFFAVAMQNAPLTD